MDFSFSEFSAKCPSGIVEALEEDGFDNLPALLSADRHDTDGLKLKKGHVAVGREATKTLQIKHREGPLRLTDIEINKIQAYYGNAIRGNTNNLVGMRCAV